jgi:hypothetical protein
MPGIVFDEQDLDAIHEFRLISGDEQDRRSRLSFLSVFRASFTAKQNCKVGAVLVDRRRKQER